MTIFFNIHFNTKFVMLEDFQFTIGYCCTIAEPKEWRTRHSFKFWHTAEIKCITRNAHNNYTVVLVANEEPLESYQISEHRFGNRHPAPEFLALYCIRNGNEYTFPNVQSPEFGCHI